MLMMATRWLHSWLLTCAKLRGCPPDATNEGCDGWSSAPSGSCPRTALFVVPPLRVLRLRTAVKFLSRFLEGVTKRKQNLGSLRRFGTGLAPVRVPPPSDGVRGVRRREVEPGFLSRRGSGNLGSLIGSLRGTAPHAVCLGGFIFTIYGITIYGAIAR